MSGFFIRVNILSMILFLILSILMKEPRCRVELMSLPSTVSNFLYIASTMAENLKPVHLAWLQSHNQISETHLTAQVSQELDWWQTFRGGSFSSNDINMTFLSPISIWFVSIKNSSSNRGSLYLCTICRKLTDTHNIDRPDPMMKGFGLSMFIFW